MQARTVGVCVDHRRKNRSEEAFQQNVARLKLYKSKLIVFPRNPTSQKAKKGDATKEETKAAQQVNLESAFPIQETLPRIKARKITKEELAANVYATLHKARVDEKLWGAREKRAKDKKEGKGKKKGEKKEEEAAPAAADE